MYFEITQFNEEYWKNVESNLTMFFKSYLWPILLGITEIYVSRNCNIVLLNQEEINENEEEQHNSVQCDRCCLWYHLGCEHLTIKEAENLPDEWFCGSCLITT